jgi:hypothetical protein
MQAKVLLLIAAAGAMAFPLANAMHASPAKHSLAAQPEIAERPAIRLPEGAIKLSFLHTDTTPIPDMSTASAVRIACGVAIDVPRYYGKESGLASTPRKLKPISKPVIESPVQTYQQTTWTARPSVPAATPSPRVRIPSVSPVLLQH